MTTPIGQEANPSDDKHDERQGPEQFNDLAEAYLTHYEDSLRGVVRHEIMANHLREHLPPPPARVVDVGGGAGHDSIELARLGYEVVLLDSSEVMLEKARESLVKESPEVQSRVFLRHGTAERAGDSLDSELFDVVMCHLVLPYVSDTRAVLSSLVRLAKPAGLLSIATKNGSALAMRPGLEGRYADAVESFTKTTEVGRLGVATKADTVQQISDLLFDLKAEIVEWYGVRVFSDHLGDEPPGPDLDDLLVAEWYASITDPYRQLGRLVHILARRLN